jgi:hypothetical protein
VEFGIALAFLDTQLVGLAKSCLDRLFSSSTEAKVLVHIHLTTLTFSLQVAKFD